jgi:hypothetical protein
VSIRFTAATAADPLRGIAVLAVAVFAGVFFVRDHVEYSAGYATRAAFSRAAPRDLRTAVDLVDAKTGTSAPGGTFCSWSTGGGGSARGQTPALWVREHLAERDFRDLLSG